VWIYIHIPISRLEVYIYKSIYNILCIHIYHVTLPYCIQAFHNFGEHKHTGISKYKINDLIAWSHKHTDIPQLLRKQVYRHIQTWKSTTYSTTSENIHIQAHPNYTSFKSYATTVTIYICSVPFKFVGIFVSFLLAAFCWQNHYYVMLLLSQGCRIFQSLQIFRVYFFDVERAVLW